MGRLPTTISPSTSSLCPLFIFIIFVCVFQSDYSYCEQHSQSNEDAARYRTGYACEGSQLNISCEEGSQILITRANYGRFSISICNDHGNLDWKVDCSSTTSRSVISERCNGREKCSVRASSDIFNDSCPGTRKYLEVQYQCKSSGVNGSLIATLMKSSSVSVPSSQASASNGQSSVRPTIIIPVTSLRKGTSSTTRGPPPVHPSPELTAGSPTLNSFDIRQLGIPTLITAMGSGNNSNTSSMEDSYTNHHHHPQQSGIASSINDTVGSINVSSRNSNNGNRGKSNNHHEESESSTRGPLGSITVKNPLHGQKRNEGKTTSRPFTHFKPPSQSSVLGTTAHGPSGIINGPTPGPALNPANPLNGQPRNSNQENTNYYNKQHGSRIGPSFESTTRVIEIRNPIHDIRFGDGISFFSPETEKSTITRPPTVASSSSSSSGSSLSNSPTSTASPSQDMITFNSVVIISLITVISVILFVSICFARNDRIRGNFKKSLSGLTWLPTCVTRSVHGKNLPPSSLVHHHSNGSSPSTPAYFYSLDPAKLQPPPSPLIRPSIHHHHNHGSGNSSGNSSASSCLNGLGTSTLSTASRGYHQIQDVNPYAAPVPISMHEYEDIGTAMKDYHNSCRTLPSGHNNLTNPPSTTSGRTSTATNVRSHNNYNNTNHRANNHFQKSSSSSSSAAAALAATLRHSHPPLDSLHHHSIHHPHFPESLYYEAASNSSNNNLGVINSSQLIYGGRGNSSSSQQQQITSNNPSTNYGFHNTRSPIYYSESRR